MSRHDRKGRSRGIRHVRRDHSMLNSPAYIGLSPYARSLLEQLQMFDNGSNNGAIFLGVQDAADRMGSGDTKTARRAFADLVEHGFIRETQGSSFEWKGGQVERRARRWRLTWLPAFSRAPTNEYRDWAPVPGSAAAKRIERVRLANLQWGFPPSIGGDSTYLAAKLPREEVDNVGVSTPSDVQNSQFAAVARMVESPPELVCHPHAGDRASATACNNIRAAAAEWLAKAGYGQQGRLAGRAGLSQSRLSRFLNDRHGRRTLTVDEIARLEIAMSSRSAASNGGGDSPVVRLPSAADVHDQLRALLLNFGDAERQKIAERHGLSVDALDEYIAGNSDHLLGKVAAIKRSALGMTKSRRSGI